MVEFSAYTAVKNIRFDRFDSSNNNCYHCRAMESVNHYGGSMPDLFTALVAAVDDDGSVSLRVFQIDLGLFIRTWEGRRGECCLPFCPGLRFRGGAISPLSLLSPDY